MRHYQRFVRSALALVAATAILVASPASSQEPSVADAKNFLKHVLLSQQMDFAGSGQSAHNIHEVSFYGDCSMILADYYKNDVATIDFKKASFDPLGDGETMTKIIVERVTIYERYQYQKPKDSSTITLEFFVLGLGQRVMNALNVLHNRCYINEYRF